LVLVVAQLSLSSTSSCRELTLDFDILNPEETGCAGATGLGIGPDIFSTMF